MKVLLVDDDRSVLEGLSRTIDWKSLGADLVGLAENGEEALRLVRSNTPDVVIADVSMPVMDGLELARQIRDSMVGVHIFLISGHDNFEYARQAIRYGVENYILKPVSRETLRSLYTELLKLQEELRVRTEYYFSQWSGSREKIKRALTEGDEDFFNPLFGELLHTCEVSPESTVTICLKLLEELYQYLEELHIPRENLESSYRHSIEEMLALRDRKDKLGLVFQKYCDVISWNGRQKHQNSASIALSAQRIVKEGFAGADLNIAALADRLGCTPSYLSTVFRQSVGVNLSVYITTLRIEAAKRMLRDLERNISDIAQKVGYADSHYFAKLFKKKTGRTPTEYRNLAIQSENLL